MIISKKYEVLRQLGQGSMGVVYKVRHTALKTVSALKVLSTHFGDHPDLVKRFYREARVLAHLKHPNIVRVIDIERDEENQFYYFVMEFIEGRTLRQYLTESGPLAVPQVLEITKQVGSALNYAHSYKPPVIHRDIKPTNIMIEDGSGRVVVMDFGIAKDFGDPGLTKAGTILGTLRYCPPEQMRYEPLEGSADIYALGMVMYEMLTGSHLFAALDEYEVVARVATPEEYDLGFPRETPASFGAIVKKALRKDPSQRYRTMAELLKDVNACCFDMEKTILVPIEGPEFERSPPGDKPEEPTTVGDEKIRTLGEQRERQQVRLLEAKAAEHKEMALRGGAAELVPSVFQAACTAEDQGRAQAQSGQFELACESLEEAIARFKDASEQAAREGLLRQADQARAQMAAAKVEADRYRAQERAHTVYRNGLMLQAKADELWEHQSYREAWEAYGEARSRFEDAQGFAHRSLQEDEAKAAQIKAREAREVAVKHGVEEHAAETFWEAVRAERRGDTVMAQGEYVQARELYQAAETQYARARQKAERERQRQAALTAQAEAQEVRRTVVAMGAMADQEAYRQGQEAQQQGDAHLTEEAFEAAAAAYAGARQRFEQAAALRQRKLAEEAREAAVQAGARERFSEDFAEVGAGFARGAAKEQAGGYGEAAEEYAQAAEGWSRLGEEAQQGLAQEQAEAGRERLEALRAQGTALRSWAAEAWTRADQRAQDAEAIWQQQRYPEAVGLFELAIRASAEACAAAEDARGQQRVVEARTQAERSEGTARAADAPQYARALFVQATLAQEEAGRSLQARRWDDAQRCYAEAHRLYLESREAAERAQVRAAAEAAEKLALAARAALQQAAAPEVFATRIEQAEALFREAQAALGQDHCVAAREGFDRSTALLRQLREEAVVQKARDRAEQARAHALRLQREIGDAGGWRVARAKSALARGHRLFEAANYAGALASFKKAASHFTVRLQATARRRREATPRVAVSWAKVLPFLALGAIAAGATVYFIKAERGPEPPGAALPARPEPPPAAPVVQRPPSSPPLRVTPIPDAGTPITIAEGGSQLFELKVEGSVSAPLRYVWFLDDVVQGEGPAWFYGPDFRAADERPKEVKVVVSDAGARSAEIRWRVQVVDTNRSPRILAAMPTMQALTLKPGETVRFAVQGEDPDSDDSLDYLWSLDGAQIAEGERWEFKGGTSSARHRVEVAVVDRAGLSEGRSWDIAVEAPPLPPLPPLAIRTASPKVRGGQELVLAEGQSQTFSIKATGGEAGALRYTWHLDGKKQATGSEWTYKAPASAGSARSQEVRVVVSDPGGNRVEQSWRVRVNRANRPPTIVKSTPIDTRIEVSSGTPQRFTVEATDADPADSLAYSWLLDGRPLAKGTAWEMDATVPAGQHRVEVKVTDKSGAAATQSWVVAIAEPAIPPSITEVKPVAERITAEAESALDFTVAASAPGRARKDAVLYEWRIDNGASRTTKTGEFRLPPLQAGTYKLSVVAVSPDGLKSAPHDWTVQIKPKATKAALAESEVHDWLERYRRAWESKDVKLLVQLGEVTRDRAAQLREVLAGYNDLRVALKDLTIQIDADSAKITFRREDTIDGKTFLQPGLKELWLEKQANGVLKRRK